MIKLWILKIFNHVTNMMLLNFSFFELQLFNDISSSNFYTSLVIIYHLCSIFYLVHTLKTPSKTINIKFV